MLAESFDEVERLANIFLARYQIGDAVDAGLTLHCEDLLSENGGFIIELFLNKG